MPATSQIELRGLVLQTDIGTYGPGDVVPDTHLMDLTLGIDPALVLIEDDGMDHVFDYDPLVLEIDRIARDGPYQTQERLMTRIVGACLRYPEIWTIDLHVTKSPVLNASGALGVRVRLTEAQVTEMRARSDTALAVAS